MRVRATLLMALVCVSSLALAKDKPTKVSGEVSCNGKTLKLVHAFGIWDEEDEELTVYLLPFEPTEEELAKMVNGEGSPFSVIMNKPSPDKKLWPQHCPYAYLIFRVKNPKKHKLGSNLERVRLNVYGMVKTNDTANLGFSAEVIKKLSKKTKLKLKKKEGTIKTAVKGATSLFGESYAWDIDVSHAKVYVKAKKK